MAVSFLSIGPEGPELLRVCVSSGYVLTVFLSYAYEYPVPLILFLGQGLASILPLTST